MKGGRLLKTLLFCNLFNLDVTFPFLFESYLQILWLESLRVASGNTLSLLIIINFFLFIWDGIMYLDRSLARHWRPSSLHSIFPHFILILLSFSILIFYNRLILNFCWCSQFSNSFGLLYHRFFHILSDFRRLVFSSSLILHLLRVLGFLNYGSCSGNLRKCFLQIILWSLFSIHIELCESSGLIGYDRLIISLLLIPRGFNFGLNIFVFLPFNSR